MKPLILVFMGTPAFAVPSLAALLDAGHRVAAVYTQPPRPSGRGQKETLSSVHRFARDHGLPVEAPATLKDAEVQARLRCFGADAIIVAAYGLLLPRAVLDMAPLGCVNIHPSLLPRWRGAAPIERTIMAGDSETGVDIMRMEAGLDTGPVLLEERIAVADGTAAGQLRMQLSQLAGPLLLQALEGLASGTLTPRPQAADSITYAPKITAADCRIDWRESASVTRQRILGLSPQPGAFFSYKGEAIKILNAELADASAPPGTVLDAMMIACGESAIHPTLLQRPGRKPLPADEWRRGFPLPAGTVLE